MLLPTVLGRARRENHSNGTGLAAVLRGNAAAYPRRLSPMYSAVVVRGILSMPPFYIRSVHYLTTGAPAIPVLDVNE